MTSIIKSSPFKIALVFAAAVTVSSYVVQALVYLHFYSQNVITVRSVLEDEIVKTRNTPVAELRQQLELRLTHDLRRIDYVGLYGKRGELTFGNVASDLKLPHDGKAHLVDTRPPQPEDSGSERAMMVAIDRPDGGALVLGRSLIYVEQLQTAMLEGSALAILPVVLLALLTGTIVSLRASRRLSQIRTAIDRVMRGELRVRLPAKGRTDDIDELVRAVNHMLDEIVRLLHQIKSVGDNIAHDLRAPLAVMRARLERGLAGGSEAALRALTEEALTDLERAMTTVTALLRISELESGLRRSAFDSVDLVLVCRDVFDLYQPLAEAQCVALSLDAMAETLVTGDGDLLREALANLVDNAIKFTPRGGRVAIACGTADALISVSDTGPGIPPNERAKIIKRFYRSQSTRHMPGVGLGLSMAATIIDLHGFGLRIGDNGPGAAFAITAVPAKPDATAASPEQAARPSHDDRPSPLKQNLMEGSGHTT